MLAFTMQFSSYGRKTQLPRRIHAARARPVVSQRHTAASSGPNSVPGTLPVACPRSVAPVKENVLTGQSQESEPTSTLILIHRKDLVLPVKAKLEYSYPVLH